jgi:hypothetical protein
VDGSGLAVACGDVLLVGGVMAVAPELAELLEFPELPESPA